MKIRPANSRGHLDVGWIESYRTFSNNSYWDPKYMNWGSVKVVNDDVQQPGNIVPSHEHRNYDILGYMVEGQLEHRDSLGNVQIASAGQIQHMWCGKSIWHTEANTGDVAARYLQIWITPKDEYRDSTPHYEIINKAAEFGDIAVELKQDMRIRAGILSEAVTSRNSYLYVVDGKCEIDGNQLCKGDGAEIVDYVTITPIDNPHILLFENVVQPPFQDADNINMLMPSDISISLTSPIPLKINVPQSASVEVQGAGNTIDGVNISLMSTPPLKINVPQRGSIEVRNAVYGTSGGGGGGSDPDAVKIYGNQTIAGNKTFTGITAGITKSMVSLSNVDNTSDVNKPVSNATQLVLDGKSSTSHTHSNVTISIAGFMSTSDKTKLDAITGTNTGDQTITLTGDVTGTGNGSFAATLKDTGPGVGTYRSVTIDVKGRVTAGTNPTTLSGYGITDAAALSGAIFTGNISATNLSGSNTGDETSSSIKTKLDITTLSGSNTGDQTITLTGDATGEGSSSINVTLADTAVVAGEYNNGTTTITPFTVDSKGRITATDTEVTITPDWSSVANTPTTLGGYNITDAVNVGETQTITGAKEFTMSPIVPRPTESNHAVNKAYADDISAGLHIHEQVHVILTIDLATATGGTVAYTNGTDGVGAKLTVTGGSTIITALNAECGEDDDLVAGENGSRIIINGEVDDKNWNGIYIITADRELTRAADFDSSVEMAGGDFVFVTHGTTHADTGWVLSEPVTTVGSSNVEFVQFSGQGSYDAGDGLHRDGTIFSVVGTAGRIVVGPSVDLATHGVSGTYQSVTTDAYGRVTSGTNPTTLTGYGITDAATSTGLSNHISDDARHLTSTQNTLIDGITVTSTKINYLSDVTSAIQSQIDGKSASGHVHFDATISVAGFMSTSDKTKLDGIASGAEVNVNADWNSISGDAQILNKPTTLAGYGITDAPDNANTIIGLSLFL